MLDYFEGFRWLWAPLSAIFVWVLWSLKKATASFDDFLGLEKKIRDESRRIDLLEGRIHCLPTKDSLYELKIQLVRLEEQHESLQAVFNNRLEPITTAIHRIEASLERYHSLQG